MYSFVLPCASNAAWAARLLGCVPERIEKIFPCSWACREGHRKERCRYLSVDARQHVAEQDAPVLRAAVVDDQADCLAVFTDGYHARLIEIRRIGLPAAEPTLLEVRHCPRHQLPRW